MSADIEHTTAEELLALVHSQLFTMSDAEICADALLTVTYVKHLKDKAIRSDDKEMESVYEEILKHD